MKLGRTQAGPPSQISLLGDTNHHEVPVQPGRLPEVYGNLVPVSDRGSFRYLEGCAFTFGEAEIRGDFKIAVDQMLWVLDRQ